MKREIKFRGKRLDNGEWLYGSLLQGEAQSVIATIKDNSINVHDCFEVVPETVGQFTGLLDRNGKEIYEGDIITVKGGYPRVVLWDKMMWALMPTEYYHDEVFWVMNLQHPGVDWWEEFADEFEIIGNIYDNPDLLNGK